MIFTSNPGVQSPSSSFAPCLCTIAFTRLRPGQSGLIDVEESVIGLLDRIDELNLTNSGSFWHTNGELLLWEREEYEAGLFLCVL